MKSHYFNAGLSVALMFIFAYKQTFLTLWPIFGAVNQLLAALTLLTVSVWLLKRKTKAYFAIIPAAFMIVTTTGSLIYLLITKHIPARNQLLIIFDLALLLSFYRSDSLLHGRLYPDFSKVRLSQPLNPLLYRPH